MILAHAARLGHSPWEWHPHPDVWLLVGMLGGGYMVALRHGRQGGEPPATRREVSFFATGLALVWLSSDWPVHDLAEGHMYSIHMVQHTVLTLIAPPLLLLGTPRWLLRHLLAPVMGVFRHLVRPLPALVMFNGALAFTHWPVATNAAVASGWAHLGQHVLLVVTATLMWWPVVERLPELGGMHPGIKMVYLFLQSLVPTVPASFLALADHPVYHSYEAFPKVWGISAGEDQQLAGAIMKVGGGLILWSIMVVVFFRWFAREGAPDPQPLLASSSEPSPAAPTRLPPGGPPWGSTMAGRTEAAPPQAPASTSAGRAAPP